MIAFNSILGNSTSLGTSWITCSFSCIFAWNEGSEILNAFLKFSKFCFSNRATIRQDRRRWVSVGAEFEFNINSINGWCWVHPTTTTFILAPTTHSQPQTSTHTRPSPCRGMWAISIALDGGIRVGETARTQQVGGPGPGGASQGETRCLSCLVSCLSHTFYTTTNPWELLPPTILDTPMPTRRHPPTNELTNGELGHNTTYATPRRRQVQPRYVEPVKRALSHPRRVKANEGTVGLPPVSSTTRIGTEPTADVARYTTAAKPTTSMSSHTRWDWAHRQHVEPHKGRASPPPACRATQRQHKPTTAMSSHMKADKPTASVLSHMRWDGPHRQPVCFSR